MTLHDIIQSTGKHPYILLAIFLVLPLLTLFLLLIQGDRECRASKIRYLYSIIIYLSCIPGIAAAVLIGYSVFFIRANLLKVNFLVYFLPLVSMIVTLLIIREKNHFIDIPGFNKIQGLLILIGLSFIVSLSLYKTMIIIGFFGGFLNLLIVAAVVFLLLKLGLALLKR